MFLVLSYHFVSPKTPDSTLDGLSVLNVSWAPYIPWIKTSADSTATCLPARNQQRIPVDFPWCFVFVVSATVSLLLLALLETFFFGRTLWSHYGWITKLNFWASSWFIQLPLWKLDLFSQPSFGSFDLISHVCISGVKDVESVPIIFSWNTCMHLNIPQLFLRIGSKKTRRSWCTYWMIHGILTSNGCRASS